MYAHQQLILSYFLLEDYEGVVEHSEIIKEKSQFKSSKQQYCYGVALKELGQFNEAEAQLKQIDRPYSNYAERLELAKFYLENDRLKDGKALLEEIATESQYMTKPNQRLYRPTIVEVHRLLKGI